jgi:putative ABC transport system permease protein
MIIQGWQAGNYMFKEIKLVKGEILSESNRGQRAVIVGKELARLKSLNVGDELTISDEKYKIAGVFDSVADIENSMVIMLLDQAQKAFGKAGEITGCTVRLKDNSPKNIASMATIVETQIAEQNHLKNKLRARAPDQFVETNGQIQMFKGFAWAVSLITLIVGGIGVLNTMFMSVFERTREIGILRAIGWRPKRVMQMILLESVTLSIGAGIVGTLIGLGAIWLMGFVPVLSGAVHAAISWQIVVKGFLIAVLVGVLGAAYPAFRGSRLLPTEALRHE